MIRKTNKSRRGVAMFAILFVMVVLGLLVVQFHRMGRQAQSSAHRFQTAEMARQLAIAGQEEAFKYLYDQTNHIYDNSFNIIKDLPKKIIERDPDDLDMTESGMGSRSSKKGLELKIPQTENLAGDRMELSAVARIVDFRNQDPDGNLFYGKEGIGTIEITVTAKPKEKYKKLFPGSCTLVRHHDYKVISLISRKEDRPNNYCNNRILDYVLFVRNGQDEFDHIDATKCYNPPDVKLEIDAGSVPGKVNLGSSGNKYVYLNLSKENADMIPWPQTFTELPELTAHDSEVDKIIPSYQKELEKKAKAKNSHLDWAKGHKLVFKHKAIPITDDAISNSTDLSDRDTAAGCAFNSGKYVIADANKKSHFYEGIKIGPIDSITKILESDVRKQFLNIGYFYFDLSEAKYKISNSDDEQVVNLAQDDPGSVQTYKNQTTQPCIDPTKMPQGEFKSSDIINMGELSNYLNSKGEELAKKAFIHINDDFPYGKDNEKIPNSGEFYKLSSSETSTPITSVEDVQHPFAHFNLFNKRYLTAEELESFGIYDRAGNKLHLRGVIQCQEQITLGDGSNPIEVDGCGVLIATGIEIKSGIRKKENEDPVICILYARDGVMKVNTSDEIQASLIAMGMEMNTSSFGALEALNLNGSLAVDNLLTSKWKKGVNHKITYDETLKPSKDVYQISIAHWTTFERILEAE